MTRIENSRDQIGHETTLVRTRKETNKTEKDLGSTPAETWRNRTRASPKEMALDEMTNAMPLEELK